MSQVGTITAVEQGKPVKISDLSPTRSALSKWGLTALTVIAVFGGASEKQAVWAKGLPPVGLVAMADLPKEAQATERAIRAGGPFPYRKDGEVFGNRERILPSHPRGYYREYTVKTPGSRDRGARRIVCGGQEVQRPDTCFYSDDHYASFRRIQP